MLLDFFVPLCYHRKMTDSEWQARLDQLDFHERHIEALEPDTPNPAAVRCVNSRHRTLAHLRMCQESWLEACIAFQDRHNPRLKMLHPWRVYEQRGFAQIPWNEHLESFRSDRDRLRLFLKTADRSRSGKINANEHTIEGLVSRIVSHEHHHLFTPR